MEKGELEKLVEEDMMIEKLFLSLREVIGSSKDAFVHMLRQYMKNPRNSRLGKVVWENSQIARNSFDYLLECGYIPIQSMVEDMSEIRDVIEDYFNRFGYTDPVAVQLRKTYVSAYDYLSNVKTLEETSLSENNKDAWNPNIVYKQYYYKFLNENLQRIKQGKNIKSLPEQFAFDTNDELGQVKSLALADSLKHIKTGQDYSNSRGDLYFLFGLKTQGQLSDEKMLEGAKRLQERLHGKHIQYIRQLEGEKELGDNCWLMERIRKKIKEGK